MTCLYKKNHTKQIQDRAKKEIICPNIISVSAYEVWNLETGPLQILIKDSRERQQIMRY